MLLRRLVRKSGNFPSRRRSATSWTPRSPTCVPLCMTAGLVLWWPPPSFGSSWQQALLGHISTLPDPPSWTASRTAMSHRVALGPAYAPSLQSPARWRPDRYGRLPAARCRSSIPVTRHRSARRDVRRRSDSASPVRAAPQHCAGGCRSSTRVEILRVGPRRGGHMAQSDDAGISPTTSTAVADVFPTHNVGKPEVREMPAEPKQYWRLIGPGIIAAGVGLASGEFILYPYIASQVGLVFVWAALVGLATQFFLNMEIERYTLATGETALTGFSRFWRHWGLVFAILTYFANLWPGWATSSATLISYLFGGEATWIAIGILLVVGLVLTLAPVVYTALERAQMLKVALVLTLILVASIFAIGANAWADLPHVVTRPRIPTELGFALLLGALAFAGAGGGQNLCQSNWIRDKGFGMGSYVPKIVSPVTGQLEAAPSTGYVFEPTPENMTRWRKWWKFANVEQLSTFVLITFVTILFTSLLAYATVFGQEGLASDISFIKADGNALNDPVGGWFGTFFWIIGAISLFAAALGIVDYTSRLGADVLKTAYFKDVNESKMYAGLVWGLILIGIVVLLSGLSQPIVLLVISAVTGGLMMFIYSALLLLVNKRTLPAEIRPGPGRVAALVW